MFVCDGVDYIMSSDVSQIIVLLSGHILYFHSISYNMKIRLLYIAGNYCQVDNM